MADSEPDIAALIGGSDLTDEQFAARKAAGVKKPPEIPLPRPAPAPAVTPIADERRRIHVEAALASIRPDHLLKPQRSAVDAWELADHFMKLYDERYPK